MAKKAVAEPETVSITYDLNELPTAQHKAGLAGLLLQIDHLRDKGELAPEYSFDAESPETKVTVLWTSASTASLFNAIYDAERVKVRVKSKWQGATLLAEEDVEETVDGKTKKVKYFVYEVVQPKGAFLQQYIVNSPDSWMKLWRDMLWSIPRGNPQSRQPFEQRADGETCKEGPAAWSDLLKFEKSRQAGTFVTGPVAGSLWLGAQAINAESISFEGRLDQTLLLHFWCLTAMIFVPQVMSPDGESKFTGYALAIPEVSNLVAFKKTYLRVLSQLPGDLRGFRPAKSVVDLAAEGALDYIEHLARLVQDDVRKASFRQAVSAMEFFHLAKIGNNIKTLSSGRIVPRDKLLRQYAFIVGKPGEKPPYANPLFRRGLMLALLNDVPWFQPFGKLFAEWPHQFFVPSEQSPRHWLFWADARRKLSQEYSKMRDSAEDPPDDNARVASAINRFIKKYLDDRLAKENPSWDFVEFRKNRKTPRDAAEARQKLAERLFLEFRSRSDQAFVAHFTGTLFRVPQFVGKDFEYIANQLIQQTDNVKTLTLMALSSNSWSPAPKKENAQ